MSVHVHVADQQALHPMGKGIPAGKPSWREACIDTLVEQLVGIAHNSRMRGIVATEPAMTAAHRHLSQGMVLAKRWYQHRAFAGRSHMGVIIAEGLAEARVIRCQANVELGVFRLGGHYPLMLLHGDGTPFLQEPLAFALLTRLLLAVDGWLIPLCGVGCGQIQYALMVEAGQLQHEAPVLSRDVAMHALHADVRHLAILGMDTHLALQVALVVVVAAVEGSRFVILQQIAVGIVLVAFLAGIPEERDDALGLTQLAVREPFAAFRSREVVAFDFLVHHVAPPVLTFMAYGYIAIDSTEVDRSLLDGMIDAEDARRCHRYPVVSPPALHHQQQIQVAAVGLIVLLEEVMGLLHEATNLAAQQHFGQDIAAVVEVLRGGRIPHSQRDSGARCQGVIYGELYGVERLVAGTYASEVHVSILDVLLVPDEAKPVAVHASVGIIYGYLRHSSRKGVGGDTDLCVLGTELLEVMQGTAHGNGDTQGLAGSLASGLEGEQQPIGFHIGPHSTPIVLCLWHAPAYHSITVGREDGGIRHP